MNPRAIRLDGRVAIDRYAVPGSVTDAIRDAVGYIRRGAPTGAG